MFKILAQFEGIEVVAQWVHGIIGLVWSVKCFKPFFELTSNLRIPPKPFITHTLAVVFTQIQGHSALVSLSSLPSNQEVHIGHLVA